MAKNIFKEIWSFCLASSIAGLIVIAAGGGSAAGGTGGALGLQPPSGQSIRLPVTRDTWISSLGDEKNGGNGGTGRLKVKGQQEYALIDIDPAPLKGKIVKSALLHMRSATSEKAPLARLGVSAIASQWREGSASGYRSEVGASCFNWASFPDIPWAYSGSTLMDVVFGRGHTLWKFADCTSPDRNGWQVCAIDPDVVAARVAGISQGFCLYDEVGSIWAVKSGKFEYTYFPNRFVYSRETASGPWLEVWTEGADLTPPEPLASIAVTTEGLPGGEAILEWETPLDKGGGKTIGFFGECVSGETVTPIPQFLMPSAGRPGRKVRMCLKDLPLHPGQEIRVTIRPVDSAGNMGLPYSRKIQVSPGTVMPKMQDTATRNSAKISELPRIAGVKISVLDLLDKVNPKTGDVIQRNKIANSGRRSFLAADEQGINLHAGRNETVCFQVNFKGAAEKISMGFGFGPNHAIKTRLYQFGYVNPGKTDKLNCPLPDPLLPVKGAISIPSNSGKVTIADQTSHSVMCELYIPHEEPPGEKEGKVTITIGDKTLELEVRLTVWNFTLPDKLSFIPEMNAYGLSFPLDGYEYYRLAHENRCCVNRLPYGWGGAPCLAPEWHGDKFNWGKWDRYVGPLLDGSAFKDCRRKNEPVDVLYLPLNENWPVSLFDHYTPSYWADDAFSEAYRDGLKNAFKAVATHCAEKKWQDTVFQFYLNNKTYYRKQARQSSAPWVFDEPVNTQDFWALRWYGLLWQEAVKPYKDRVKLWFRSDISYSQFSRDMLWGIMDVEYLGGNNDQKTRMKHDEQDLFGKSYFAEYGSANKIEDSNLQPVLWCLSAWARGAMGVLPWQTIGNEKSWTTAEQTALFYPHPDGPVPSVRLKAFMVGQQLVEYLTLFCRVYEVPRLTVAEWVKGFLNLDGKIEKVSEADAGTLLFRDVDATDLLRLRNVLGEMISKKAPPYQRALVEWESPVFDVDRLPDIGYANPVPYVQPVRPDCVSFRPD